MNNKDSLYPDVFEDTTLDILHTAFLHAAHLMAGMQPIGNESGRYWHLKHAAEHILEAMDKIEDAAYEWRGYLGQDQWWGDKPEQKEPQV